MMNEYMWIDEDNKTGQIGLGIIIDDMCDIYHLTWDQAWDLCYAIYIEKCIEYKAKDKIYTCDDSQLYRDISKKWLQNIPEFYRCNIPEKNANGYSTRTLKRWNAESKWIEK